MDIRIIHKVHNISFIKSQAFKVLGNKTTLRVTLTEHTKNTLLQTISSRKNTGWISGFVENAIVLMLFMLSDNSKRDNIDVLYNLVSRMIFATGNEKLVLENSLLLAEKISAQIALDQTYGDTNTN